MSAALSQNTLSTSESEICRFQHASFNEKSQIQALDRTAPILPLRPGLPERQTHDYKRYGTTTLFAAFNILNGKVIGSCLPRHRGKEFLKFLNQLEKQCPRIWMCISSWTTTVLIRALPSSVGSSRRNGSGSTFTSPRPAVPGSIRWSVGLG